MEFIQNQNIENILIVCGKDETHSKYLELLFENKKRTGGDEIEQFIYDKQLKQYVIIYKDSQTVENVMVNEKIIYNNEKFIPMRLEKNKFIIENIDENLEKDILILYAESLLQDNQNSKCSVDHLNGSFFIVNCDKIIDFDRLKERFARRPTIKNRELVLHPVAKLNTDEVSYKFIEYRNLYFFTYDRLSRDSLIKSDESNEHINDEGFIEIFPRQTNNKLLIQDPVLTPASFLDSSTLRERLLEDRIKFLEEKLKGYDNLKSTMIKIKNLSQECFRYDTIEPLSRLQEPLKNAITTSSDSNNLNISTIHSSDNQASASVVSLPSSHIDSASNLKQIKQIKAGTGIQIKRNLFERDLSCERQPEFVSKASKEIETYKKNLRLQIQKRNEPRSTSNSNSNNTKNVFLRSEGTLSRLQNQTPRHNDDTVNRSSFFDNFEPSRFSQHYFRLQASNNKYSSARTPPWALSSPSPSSSRSPSRNVSPILSPIISLRESLSRPLNQGSGLNENMISRFPIIKYNPPKSITNSLNDLCQISDEDYDKQNTCTICLEKLVADVNVRLLSCFHQFHVECIDTWLKEKSICPSCKCELRKSLMSTDY